MKTFGKLNINLIYSVLSVISKNEINFYWPKGATVKDFLTSKNHGEIKQGKPPLRNELTICQN